MSFLSYFYYKLFAVAARLVAQALGGWPPATPDEVRHIPSRERGRTIKVHVYHAASTKGPSPVLINFHGSGFVIPMHGSDHEFCRQISEETKYTVLDVAYRLAPEYPFPAAINDVEDAIKYALGRPEEFDLSHVSLSGFSAGGNMSLAASAVLFPPGTFRSLIGIYPPTDLATDASLKVAPDPNGTPIPVFVARLFNLCYLPPTVDKRDPRISPKNGPLERFPRRMLIITCAGDSLAPETEELAKNLQQEGRYVVHERMNGCNHAWDKSAKEGTPQDEAKKRAYKLAVELLNE